MLGEKGSQKENLCQSINEPKGLTNFRRDERPPQSSSPGGSVKTAANRRWIPPSTSKRDALKPIYNDRNDSIFRKVRGILNKLTPEKFDKLSLELLNVGIDSQTILKGIILLIFEKALDEPKYSSLYANLCHRLCEDAPNFEPPSSSITTFRRLLLNKCQDEFENRSRATEVFNQCDGPLTPDEEEQFLIARGKMLGNIKFIGELGKLEMLHEGILHRCIKQLLEKKKKISPSDMAENMECLCQIMRTVGKRLDHDKARLWMDQYFQRIRVYMDNPALPSRIRFMLQDILELRSNNWRPRNVLLADHGPKTIQQVREDAAKEFGVYMPHGRGGPPMGLLPGMGPGGSMGPGVPGLGLNLDLFDQPLNGSVSPGARGGMSDVFSSMPPHFMGNGGIGTGPGVIPIDNFASGYRGNMGGRHGNPAMSGGYTGGGGGQYGGTRRGGGREAGGGASPKFGRDNSEEGGERGGRDGRDGKKYNNRDNRNNQEQNHRNRDNQEHKNYNNERNQYQRGGGRDGNHGNNRAGGGERAREAAGGRELPPRFRKQQQTSPREQGGGSPGPAHGQDGPKFIPPSSTQQQVALPTSRPPGSNMEEVNLRPAKNFAPILRPNIPSMLPKSAQAPPMNSGLRGPPPSVVEGPPIPNPLVQKQAKVTIRKMEPQEKPKNNNHKAPSLDELKEATESMLNLFLQNGEVNEAVNTIRNIKPPKKFAPEMVRFIIRQTLDTSDTERENVTKLILGLKEAGIINSDNFMDGFQGVLDQMEQLEPSIPLVKSYMARVAAEAVGGEMITLSELAEPLEGGVKYPLFLLCLQQIHKVRDKEWLVQIFNDSKLDLLKMLPECDRSKERLNEILEDRGLSFMFPLLRVQSDLWKQIRTDATPANIYKWIKENVDPKLRDTPGFINIVVSSILRYITQESTAREDLEQNALPEKTDIEMEKDLMEKWRGVLQMFLHDSPALQITAVYAVQVLCYNFKFPKGMLLRMFMNLYDMEVIDEEVFLRWKEEVNPEYPGKGKALFQVNSWLTWLEQAEEESEEEDDDEDN